MRMMTRNLLVVVAMVAGFGWSLPVGSQEPAELRSPGALSAAHAHLETDEGCLSCHEPDQTFAPGKCLVCHEPIAERIASQKGVHREISDECAMCHEEHAGRGGELVIFDPEDFEHFEETGFPIDGMHSEAATDCTICHDTQSYLTLDPVCSSCHGDFHAESMGATCADCHNVDDGFRETGRAFDHGRTGFVLNDRHASLPCAICHGGRASKTLSYDMSDSCTSCHRDLHAGGLGTRCQDCHGGTSFQVSEHTHRGDPSFFRGRHASASCEDCHVDMAKYASDDPARLLLFSTVNRADCSTCHDDAHGGALGSSCSTCHDFLAGSFANASRDFHKVAVMPLEGRHLAVPCAECHWNGQIEGTPTRCYDCHWIRRQDDRYRTALGVECEQCHRPTSWTAVNWDHTGATGVPLAGAHATLDCDSCHVGGRFDGGTPTDCVGCHLGDYQGTDDPDHIAAGFPTDCQLCHSPTDGGWGRTAFNHATFPLLGTHATLDCAECHSSGVFQGLPGECVDCHRDNHQQTRNPDHGAAGFNTDCKTCHQGGDPSWQAGRYPHSIYPLVATHATQPCNACHSSNVFQGLPSDCVDCHITDYQGTENPDHVAASFPTDCVLCHSNSSPTWQGATFDHSAFQLTGGHTTLDCADCHSSGVYQGLPSNCVDCHITDYRDAENPDHAAASFPTDCLLCHSRTSPTWQGATTDHSSFQLVGTHATLDCAECHSSGVYQGLPSECVDCHSDDYHQTTNPQHPAAGFNTDCATCHQGSDPSWQNGQYPHSIYPLVASHAAQPCNACHSTNVFQGLPSECVDCHLGDYQQADDPDHIAAGFPTTCELCHTPTSPTWQGATFDHSGFQLVGTHATLDCTECHSSGVYQGLPSECVDCHLGDYQQADDPDHIAAGFPTTCELCHTPTSPTWQGATFDHSGFQLVGTHATLDCTECHSSGVYQGLPSECVDCHLGNYQQADNPNHIAAGFDTSCDGCHQPSDPSWQDGQYPHSIFPLMAAHDAQPCNACHSSSVFQGLPSECVDCHLGDYQQADDPNHIAAGFPTDCELCHSSTSPTWQGATFDHSAYQLVGTHATLDCTECHSSGVYQGLPSECVDCHLTNYQQADDPDHIAAGFPTDCELCHSAGSGAWTPATFDHTGFTLVGTHATLQCVDCHSSGVYQGLPSECVDCHLDNYQQTSDPNHTSAGFPTDCQICHRASDLSWDQGSFDHIWFPINSGAHSTFRCSRCHPTAGNYAIFSCTNSCHGQGQTNRDHEGVTGYLYNSAACLSCHPDGQSDFGRSRLVRSHESR